MAIPSHLPDRAGDHARWVRSPMERTRRTAVTPMQRPRAEAPPAPGPLEAFDPLLRDAMLAAAPQLRRSAMALSRNADRADDLVQETLLRAMVAIGSFQPGSNMAAWMTTIQRNLYRSEQRKRRREIEDPEGLHVARLVSPPSQEGCMAMEEFRVALEKAPSGQREALILVGAFGFTYAEAGAACGIATGTVKSRVHRARLLLSGLLGHESLAGSGQASPPRGPGCSPTRGGASPTPACNANGTPRRRSAETGPSPAASPSPPSRQADCDAEPRF